MNKEINNKMIIFEFFSGIGGIHEAIKSLSDINIKRIFPFDINPSANITYFYNYNIKPYQLSIESFTIESYESQCQKEEANESNIIWTMSPPCQPFTRQGNKMGLEDNRSNAFKHLVNIFQKTKYPPTYFLLENVKNFEESEASTLITSKLKEMKYSYQQFLFSPLQFNIPNSRLRYYLIARSPSINKFNEKQSENIITDTDLFKNEIEDENDIQTFLNYSPSKESNYKEYYLTKKILEKESTKAIDIVVFNSRSCNCFTKNYTRLLKGSGSILLIKKDLYKTNLDFLTVEGYLRYFTPEEILKLLCFKNSFSFPSSVTLKSKYKLLGNSISVKVVKLLLKYLISN